MNILGIETSCDETSVAIVTDSKEILSHEIYSQIKEHQIYKGVVPEIASRAHLDILDNLLDLALQKSNLSLSEIDAIAVTAGPGLIGGLLVGVMTAKAICYATHKPFIAVNHLEGHALTVRLENDIKFPFLLLLVSGGHCQFLIVESVGKYKKLGTTIDDAVGEAFDKVAKMMDISYPGGPQIEKLALKGDEDKYEFPLPLLHSKDCNMSFSGLKTAVKRKIDSLRENNQLNDTEKANIAASFQNTIRKILSKKLQYAFNEYEKFSNKKDLVIAGGVAANEYLKSTLTELCKKNDYKLYTPSLKLCTDNGAMIAWAGIERYKLGLIDQLDFKPRARWSLENL